MLSERATRQAGIGSVDDAMAAYSVQLRAWVDLQVDARFNNLIHGTVEPELVAARSASAAAIATCERLEGQLGEACIQQSLVADGQAQLLTLVEGISDETERIKAAVLACQAAVAQATVQASAAQTAAAAASSGSPNDAASHSEALQCVERALTTAGAVEARLERHESELRNVLQLQARNDQRIQDLAAARDIQDAQLRDVVAKRRLGEEEELELRDKFAKLLESRFAAWRGDLASEIAEDIRAAGRAGGEQAEERFARKLEAIRNEEAMLCKHTARSESEEIRSQVRASETMLRQEVASARQALTAELASAMRSEAAAIAALDEQLWLTDQRLGQRVDELARAQREQFMSSRVLQEPCVPQSTFKLSPEVHAKRLGSPRPP
jgi:hypothetical protein